FDLEFTIERSQRKHKTDRGTVRIRHDEAAASNSFLLQFKRIEMVGVDFRHEQRDVGFHSMTCSVAQYRHPSFRELKFRFLRDGRWQSRQHELAIQTWLARLDRHLCHSFGN